MRRRNSARTRRTLRIAIIHEDGAYGVDVSKGNEEGAKEGGLNVVLDEGYSATAPDLSSLVTKLKRARPDVIFHTGYNPDISLFLRQARELGLRFSALIGHGAGYTDYTRIKQAVGTDANYFFDVDPISIWDTNPKSLKPELPPMIQMVGDAYMKRSRHDHQVAACRQAASNTYLFLTDVLPRAITKYGGVNAEALARRRAIPMRRMVAPCWASASVRAARKRRWRARTPAPSLW